MTPGYAKTRRELPWLYYPEADSVQIINAHNFPSGGPSLAVNGKTPIAAWVPSLDTAGNGTTALTDLIGSNDGTLTNMDTATDWVLSDGKYALDFDGTLDRVITSGYTAAPSTGDQSWSFWIFTRDTGSNDDYISNRELGALGTKAGINIGKSGSTDNKIISLIDRGGGSYRLEEWLTVLSLSTWTHLVVTWDNSSGAIDMYKNGVLLSANRSDNVGTVAGQTIGSTGDLHFSGRPSSTDRILNGRLDDIRQFDVVLDATDASDLYTAQRGGDAS